MLKWLFYVKTWIFIMYVNCTYFFKMSLISICGGMELHMYIAQVSLCYDCEGGLLRIWTKCIMNNVVVSAWVLLLCYELWDRMFRATWRCYDLLNMLCLYGDFLGTLGESSIMGWYLDISLVWPGGCIRWWFLCEVMCMMWSWLYKYMWLFCYRISMKDYLRWVNVIHCIKYTWGLLKERS